MTRDPATADDIVSETFLRLAIEFRAGRAPCDGPAWIHRVARNLAVSRARRTNVANRALSRLVDRSVVQSPEIELVDRERDVRVRNALATLANDDRRVVVLAARGYQPAEIAMIVDKPRSATRTRLCRARRQLRTRLEPADSPQALLPNYVAEIEAFQRAAATGGHPAATGLDGLRVVEITRAMIESARTRRSVKVARVEP